MCTQASTQHTNDCIQAMPKLCVPSTQQFKLCVNHIKILIKPHILSMQVSMIAYVYITLG